MSWHPIRTLKARARGAVADAGEHVAGALTTAAQASGRTVLAAIAGGLLLGAALVWLGVSLGRQPT